jgi:hypothetical protein
MSKTKQQKQAEERAAKKTAAQPEVPAVGPTPGQINGDTGKVNEQPKPKVEVKAATTATQPATPNKQQMTIGKLTAAFREQRQIEVKPEMLKQDGKFINMVIGKEWPTIRIGNSGGITVMELKSYTSAFEAAVKGDVLLAKQKEREGKKAIAPAQQPAVKAATASAPPVTAPEVKAKAAA